MGHAARWRPGLPPSRLLKAGLLAALPSGTLSCLPVSPTLHRSPRCPTWPSEGCALPSGRPRADGAGPL
eukprot:11274786-Alexandrium_andersonii.AAC.1